MARSNVRFKNFIENSVFSLSLNFLFEKRKVKKSNFCSCYLKVILCIVSCIYNINFQLLNGPFFVSL